MDSGPWSTLQLAERKSFNEWVFQSRTFTWEIIATVRKGNTEPLFYRYWSSQYNRLNFAKWLYSFNQSGWHRMLIYNSIIHQSCTLCERISFRPQLISEQMQALREETDCYFKSLYLQIEHRCFVADSLRSDRVPHSLRCCSLGRSR